jgi:uncharacterized membrane protein required for colicin V production
MGRTIAVNWIDWTTLAIVLVSILRGTRYGISAGVIDLVAMVGAFVGADALYTGPVPGLHTALSIPTPWGGFLSFTVIWLALYIFVGAIVRLVHGVKTSPLSAILGGVMGTVRGIALSTLVLAILLAAPFRDSVEPDAKHSLVGAILVRLYTAAMPAITAGVPVRIPRIGPGGVPF